MPSREIRTWCDCIWTWLWCTVLLHAMNQTTNVFNSSARRQKGLTGYCFKYTDRPFCLQANKLQGSLRWLWTVCPYWLQLNISMRRACNDPQPTVMAQSLRRVSQDHEMYCPWSGGQGSNPSWVELGSSWYWCLSRAWTKNIIIHSVIY